MNAQVHARCPNGMVLFEKLRNAGITSGLAGCRLIMAAERCRDKPTELCSCSASITAGKRFSTNLAESTLHGGSRIEAPPVAAPSQFGIAVIDGLIAYTRSSIKISALRVVWATLPIELKGELFTENGCNLWAQRQGIPLIEQWLANYELAAVYTKESIPYNDRVSGISQTFRSIKDLGLPSLSSYLRIETSNLAAS